MSSDVEDARSILINAMRRYEGVEREPDLYFLGQTDTGGNAKYRVINPAWLTALCSIRDAVDRYLAATDNAS
jgi:hypothetical protein